MESIGRYVGSSAAGRKACRVCTGTASFARRVALIPHPLLGRRCLQGIVGSVAILGLTISSPAPASDGFDQRVQFANPAIPIGNFELTDQDGRKFALSDLSGQTALLFFGFTHCQSVCPPTMQKLRQVYRSLAEDGGRLACVLVSVDGERDSPAVLKEYLEPFLPGFIGLTADPKQVSAIAAGFSAVFFKGRQTDLEGGYEVEHTSQVYLIDAAGRLRATFYNAQAGDMVEVTRSVLNETD